MGVSDGSGRVATAIGLLITQRSQVQILPPLPSSQSEASSDHGRGLLRMPCAPNCARGLRGGPPRRLGGETYPADIVRDAGGGRTSTEACVRRLCDGLQIKCNPPTIDP